jgi:hypothetical protein
MADSGQLQSGSMFQGYWEYTTTSPSIIRSGDAGTSGGLTYTEQK